MKITAYPLYRHAVVMYPPLQPTLDDQSDAQHSTTLDAKRAHDRVNRHGWQLLCPHAFTATWNGGPNPEDIEIQLIKDATEATTLVETDFMQSQSGEGLLTFYPGYQFKTEAGYLLWARGPLNASKAAAVPVESLTDTSVLPCTLLIQWQFTRPNQTIRFAAGEPFAVILPYVKRDLEDVTMDVVPFDADVLAENDAVDAYELAFQRMLDQADMQGVFQRLSAASAESMQPEAALDHTDIPALISSEEVEEHLAVIADTGKWATQLTDPPPVSCICPTYGRVALLEEAVESFLRQDYPGQKELIILNDYAGQTLVFDHPEVQVINVPQRLHSIGEKYKMAVGLASHDLIFVWHDDDIYLPHRISYSVAHLDPDKAFFKADKAWFWNSGKLSGPDANTFHGGSCWRRDLFDRVQGYPHVNNTYDVDFEQRCRSAAHAAIRVHPMKPADVYYLYRWQGTNSYHLSLIGAGGQSYQAVEEYVAQQALRGEIPQGQIDLHPQWKRDYAALAQTHLATLSVEAREAVEEEISFPPPFFVIPPPPPVPAVQGTKLFRGNYPAKMSVILPAANESVLLQRTVEQFAATLPENSEIIVVDNGSTDGSSDFLLDGTWHNVNLIRTPDALGVSGARNRGLMEAKGEIVVFADAHIDLPIDWWQPLVAILNQSKVGIVGPGIGVMGKPEHNVACGQRIAEAKLRVEWLAKQGEEPYAVPTLGGGFMAMRQDTLIAVGAFDEGMPQWGSEDLEICVRYWLLGYEVWVAPAVTILHYFRKANPYKVEWGAVTHNLLRVALLHFNQRRLARVLAALKGDAKFEQALAQAVESDVWEKRATFAARRVYNDDWLFEKFADSCQV